MKTIQPELCTLASPGVPLPRQAYSSSHLNEASENETAIVGVGTLLQRKGKENENREEIVLLRCTVCPFLELLQAVRTITR